ncbi:blr1546 [Bradyrhizobium diazoefficiens USDA 110]|uniref:Blr1546 protein n=1 Tax=Bradyrhizobium diazoefficiens (strain JCM 10833 / BCRC 13528 / IAM 13628 / NBRC 14792 / USDA 110) TaxID=224911 RepID=Q89U73_BRADU|nr:hypothetical protein CO678_39620 [Bradyrhizobium diazoefficiens]QBP26980.1 hypothetical protein Bdiaspc4_07800 [Bradyrhizobium diazoefficiens]BAC46811.1 blr1546 [Bradyrhizobium diazoefficiens USDA 110]
MTRRFRHSSPRLSSVSRCLGPTQVVTPFHHLSGDSHHHDPLLEAGPITASSSTWWETGSPRFESQKVIRHAIARDIGTTTPSAARLPSQNAAQSAIIVRRFDRADIGLDGHGAIGVLRNRA